MDILESSTFLVSEHVVWWGVSIKSREGGCKPSSSLERRTPRNGMCWKAGSHLQGGDTAEAFLLMRLRKHQSVRGKYLDK